MGCRRPSVRWPPSSLSLSFSLPTLLGTSHLSPQDRIWCREAKRKDIGRLPSVACVSLRQTRCCQFVSPPLPPSPSSSSTSCSIDCAPTVRPFSFLSFFVAAGKKRDVGGGGGAKEKGGSASCWNSPSAKNIIWFLFYRQSSQIGKFRGAEKRRKKKAFSCPFPHPNIGTDGAEWGQKRRGKVFFFRRFDRPRGGEEDEERTEDEGLAKGIPGGVGWGGGEIRLRTSSLAGGGRAGAIKVACLRLLLLLSLFLRLQ